MTALTPPAGLTPQVLARLRGGSARISNDVEDYVFEGEIDFATLKEKHGDIRLHVSLSELRRVSGKGGVNVREYAASLCIYRVTVEADCVILESSIMHERTVLHMPAQQA